MTRYIYEIARNPKAPGSYSLIDGVMLVDEGSNELYEDECFQDACDELRRTFDKPEMRFAEVVDGEIVAFSLPVL